MPLKLRNYRLTNETMFQIRDLQESKNGRVTETSVITAAVKALHRSVFGRRSADLTPPTIRQSRKG